MVAALRAMRGVLRGVDLVIDVRDARAPETTAPAPPLAAVLSGGGGAGRRRSGSSGVGASWPSHPPQPCARPRLIVLNKADLAPAEAVRRAVWALEAKHASARAPVRVVAVSAAAAAAVSAPASSSWGSGGADGKEDPDHDEKDEQVRRRHQRHYHRSLAPLLEAAALLLRERTGGGGGGGGGGVAMVVGAPNTGKSSLINAMRRGLANGETATRRRALVGDTPGLTRQVSGFRVPLLLPAAAADALAADAQQPQPQRRQQQQHGYFDARAAAAASDPALYPCFAHVLDTPGISAPAVRGERDARVLAMLGCLRAGTVSEERQAAHLVGLFRRSGAARRELARAERRLLLLSKGRGHASRRSGPAARAWAAAGAGRRAAEGDERRRRDALAACRALLRVSAAAGSGEGRWHPALDDDYDDGVGGDDDDNDQNEAVAAAAALAEALGQDAGARDPSGAGGALSRALSAFRSGALGKYCLDDDDDADG
jgi:ribosome biogenesis GTPase A